MTTRTVTAREVIEMVAGTLGVSRTVLLKGKQAALTTARQDAAWLARRLTGRTELQLAVSFGCSQPTMCRTICAAEQSWRDDEATRERRASLQRRLLGLAEPEPAPPLEGPPAPPAPDVADLVAEQLRVLVEAVRAEVEKQIAQLIEPAAAKLEDAREAANHRITQSDNLTQMLDQRLGMLGQKVDRLLELAAARPGLPTPAPRPLPAEDGLSLARQLRTLAPQEMPGGGLTGLAAAVQLLRRRDYAVHQPDPDRHPDHWVVGTKEMHASEVVAMAERIRTRTGAR